MNEDGRETDGERESVSAGETDGERESVSAGETAMGGRGGESGE